MEKKDIDALLAFSEWLDQRGTQYLVMTTAGEAKDAVMVMHGDEEVMSMSLAYGMLKHPELYKIMLKAMVKLSHLDYERRQEQNRERHDS